MLNIILFGAPGSGKGTQAAKLVEKYGLIHISTGDLIREEISKGTELGLTLAADNAIGKYAPDNVVAQLLDNKLHEHRGCNGFIFDGFPRTLKQAQILDGILVVHKMELSHCIHLHVPNEILLERIIERGKTSERRDDQILGVIVDRINRYEEITEPLLGYYIAEDILKHVSGLGEIDTVFKTIVKEIEG